MLLLNNGSTIDLPMQRIISKAVFHPQVGDMIKVPKTTCSWLLLVSDILISIEIC